MNFPNDPNAPSPIPSSIPAKNLLSVLHSAEGISLAYEIYDNSNPENPLLLGYIIDTVELGPRNHQSTQAGRYAVADKEFHTTHTYSHLQNAVRAFQTA
jgi:hypothetical protein